MEPAIIVVEPDHDRRLAIDAELVGRYGERHGVTVFETYAAGRGEVHRLHDVGADLAACLTTETLEAGQTGEQLLEEVRASFPDAKRVLLCEFADEPIALRAMSDELVHQYVACPWDPAEAQLFPVLDDLLADWRAVARRSTQGIRVVGARWSPATHAVKDFLARNEIPYHFLDVDHDPTAARLLDRVTHGSGRTPAVLLPDGTALVEPSLRDLAARVGLHTEATSAFYDLTVLGAGPAGLAAGVYGASEGLRVALIESEAPGGQAGTSSRIENYLGFPSGISGADLARRATEQVERFGADLLVGVEATALRVEGDSKVVTLSDGNEIRSHAVLVATGMTLRHLPAEGIEHLVGSGVYYGAAPSEASEYQDARVAVIGSANSAGQAAVMLSRYASYVTMLVRGESLEADMSRYLIRQIEDHPNIEVRVRAEVIEATGDGHLESVTVRNRDTDQREPLEVSGLFVFIGSTPHSEIVAGVVALDDEGFILTGRDLERSQRLDPARWRGRTPSHMETSVPGIFAAGDVRSGSVRRVASAVGEGSVCISLVHQYLATR